MVVKPIPSSHIRGGGRRGDSINGSETRCNGGTRQNPIGIQVTYANHISRIPEDVLLLLTSYFLSPPSSYAFFEAISALLHLKVDVQPLLAYMRWTLKAAAPVGPTLSSLYIDDHVTGGRS